MMVRDERTLLTGVEDPAYTLYSNENLGAPTVEPMEDAGCPVVIALARDFGTDAHEIGVMLQERLGIPLYDNEIANRAAQRIGTAVDKVAAYDEMASAEMMAFLPDRFDARTFGDRLFAEVKQVIQDLAASGSCIIVGRLSDYILRENTNVIKVLVTAPKAERVRILAERRGISEKKAARRLRELQHNRDRFYKRYSAGKWKVSSGKDLVVNRAVFGVEGCCELIARAYEIKVHEVDGR